MPRDNYSIVGDNPRSWQANYQGRLSRSEFHEGQVPLKARGSCSWCWYSWRHIQRVWNILICSSGGKIVRLCLCCTVHYGAKRPQASSPPSHLRLGLHPFEKKSFAPTEVATPWPTSTRQPPRHNGRHGPALLSSGLLTVKAAGQMSAQAMLP
jgi:hypothetical protein